MDLVDVEGESVLTNIFKDAFQGLILYEFEKLFVLLMIMIELQAFVIMPLLRFIWWQPWAFTIPVRIEFIWNFKIE